jgi:hypothetical protein
MSYCNIVYIYNLRNPHCTEQTVPLTALLDSVLIISVEAKEDKSVLHKAVEVLAHMIDRLLDPIVMDLREELSKREDVDWSEVRVCAY